MQDRRVKAVVNGCASLFVNESASLSINDFVSAFVKEAASLFVNGISSRTRDHHAHQAPLKTKGARGVVDVRRAFTRAAALCSG
jgi:hypothetical protein